MYKGHKAILVIFIMLLLGFDILLAVNSYYCYTSSEAVKTILKAFIPLVVLLIYYSVSTRHVGKLLIKRSLLLNSLLSFVLLIMCKILYYSLVIDKLYMISSLLYIPAILCLVLAFIDNFQGESKPSLHFRLIIVSVIFLQLFLSFNYILFSIFGYDYYTNLRRYEFIKYHYFSSEEFSYLPSEIPEDATNITFYCEINSFLDSSKALYLEYDSQTVDNAEHHAYYNIAVP